VPSGGKAKFIQGKEQKPLSRNLTPRKQFSLQEGFYLKQHLGKSIFGIIILGIPLLTQIELNLLYFCICIAFWNFETVRKFMLLPSILIFDI